MSKLDLQSCPCITMQYPLRHVQHSSLRCLQNSSPALWFPNKRARRSGPSIRESTISAASPASLSPSQCNAIDRIKWNEAGLVAVIVQDVDTGEVLMQAYADAAGIQETLQTGLATFYSRSRKERWCKGETSGNYISVKGVFLDCDKDSVIYLGDPTGPSCHTGSHTCWFSELAANEGGTHETLDEAGRASSPLSSLLALEKTIEERKAESQSTNGSKNSWTAKLLSNPQLLCSKVREEAGELCQSLEENEGKERAASEMADLLYHSMVLLNLQGVSFKDVSKVLRSRFGTSGIAEKQSRPPK